MYRNSIRLHLVTAFVLLYFAACNGPEQPVYKTITEATLKAGEPIPLPDDKIILTVTGNIGTTNQDEQIVMDIATIESVGQVEYVVHDPFKEEEVTYSGVLMNDLLDLWQVPAQAETLHMMALNDYQVDVPLQLIHDYPIIFALQADGVYMPVTEKGPAMLVLPYDHYEFERPSSDAYWIWQIKSIDVE